jgi:hypothetical protein
MQENENLMMRGLEIKNELWGLVATVLFNLAGVSRGGKIAHFPEEMSPALLDCRIFFFRSLAFVLFPLNPNDDGRRRDQMDDLVTRT